MSRLIAGFTFLTFSVTSVAWAAPETAMLRGQRAGAEEIQAALTAGAEERPLTKHAREAFEAWLRGYVYWWPERELDLLTQYAQTEDTERGVLKQSVDEMYRQRATAIMEFLRDVGFKTLYEAIEKGGGPAADGVISSRYQRRSDPRWRGPGPPDLFDHVSGYFHDQLDRHLGLQRSMDAELVISSVDLGVRFALQDPHPTARTLRQWDELSDSDSKVESQENFESEFVNYFTGMYTSFANYLGAVWKPVGRPGVQFVGTHRFVTFRVRYRTRYGKAPGPWLDDFDPHEQNEFFLIDLAPGTTPMPRNLPGFETIVQEAQDGYVIQISRAYAFEHARDALAARAKALEAYDAVIPDVDAFVDALDYRYRRAGAYRGGEAQDQLKAQRDKMLEAFERASITSDDALAMVTQQVAAHSEARRLEPALTAEMQAEVSKAFGQLVETEPSPRPRSPFAVVEKLEDDELSAFARHYGQAGLEEDVIGAVVRQVDWTRWLVLGPGAPREIQAIARTLRDRHGLRESLFVLPEDQSRLLDKVRTATVPTGIFIYGTKTLDLLQLADTLKNLYGRNQVSGPVSAPFVQEWRDALGDILENAMQVPRRLIPEFIAAISAQAGLEQNV